jgi:hypothetical protein
MVIHTNEQKKISGFWDDLYETRNLMVNAKAGSGKSITSMECADHVYRSKKYHTLILTFSTMLKLEGRKQVLSKKKEHIQVESYHSSVANLFGFDCVDTQSLELFLDNKDAEPIDSLLDFGLLVIDEAQDLTENYVTLINRIRLFLSPNHKILMLGDRFQNIFQSLQNSSPRFIDNPELYFGGTFHRLNLSYSFRLTRPMTNWINTHLNPHQIRKHYPKEWEKHKNVIQNAWGGGVRSHESTWNRNQDVDFIRYNYYKSPIPQELTYKVKGYIKQYGIDSILIIVNSCRLNRYHPASKLINSIEDNMKNNWIVLNGNFQEDAEIMQKKGVVATPYKMKGREYKVVIFFGLDEQLEKWSTAQNPLLAHAVAYVACTRAIDKLIVVSNSNSELFFTMRQKIIDPPKRISRTVPIDGLVKYCAFDRDIDVLDTTVVQNRAPGFSGVTSVKGRINGTFEPVDRWYNIALREAIPQALDGSPSMPWVERIRRIVHKNSNDKGSTYVERQLINYREWVDVKHLDHLLKSSTEMLYSHFAPHAFHHSVRVKRGKLKGEIFLVFGGKYVVHLECSKTFSPSQAQHALLNALVQSDGRTDQDETLYAYVLNPIMGELRKVQGIPDSFTREQYLVRILKRKGVTL